MVNVTVNVKYYIIIGIEMDMLIEKEPK